MELQMQVYTPANWIWAPELSFCAATRYTHGARLVGKKTTSA